jgi:hypothetical protein
MPLSLSQTTRRLLLAIGTAAGTLALASPAMAGGVKTATLTSALFAGQTPVDECSAAPMTQPFLSWGDQRSYVLAPNGDFSDASGGGWQFASGAQVTSADGADGAPGVLTLAAGATALSPLMCVDLDYPTARTWTSGSGSLNIQVVYPDSAKKLDPKTVADIKGSAVPAWRLSSDFNVQPQIGGKLAGWRRVAFVLTNTGKSPVQVDDLFVDPRMR